MGSHSGFEHYHLAYATGAFLLYERRIVADTMLIAVIYEPHGQEGVTFLNDDEESEEAVFEGVSAHASTPEKGDNAITQFLGSYCDENLLLQGLSDLFPHGETDGSSCGLGFSDELSGSMTCVLSLLSTENGRINGGIDIRFPLDRRKAEISEIVCGKLREAGFEIVSCDGVEPHCTDESSSFVQGLIRVYERVTGEKGRCIAIGGGTYGSSRTRTGICTVPMSSSQLEIC